MTKFGAADIPEVIQAMSTSGFGSYASGWMPSSWVLLVDGDLDAYSRFRLARERERVHHARYQDRCRLIP
ncbi:MULTISPECIES: hypothetical protein [Streptosporangium]|uniref:Uncharacterized protein n=1 Tax=Streptosporangium brasiliense TaxID=47480 RepID=A0ABT9RK09_9ACTN|nr:hypothetical protein [Streptosporangium brasiliense]MDP9869182.1 hypothetical protein [Streptosporangium brasiliense]